MRVHVSNFLLLQKKNVICVGKYHPKKNIDQNIQRTQNIPKFHETITMAPFTEITETFLKNFGSLYQQRFVFQVVEILWNFQKKYI